jgi:hypothetical protein
MTQYDNRFSQKRRDYRYNRYFTKKLNISDNCEKIIAVSRFTLEPWKTVPSTTLCPLYDPLSPVLPYVPFTALRRLYGPSVPFALYHFCSPAPPLRPSTPH